MAQNFNRAGDYIRTQLQDGIKTYCIFDGNDRLQYQYDAPLDAVTGSPCLVTQYGYILLTGRVEKRKEYLGVWDSTWDLP